MNKFQSTRNVSIHSMHRSNASHRVFVLNDFKRNWSTKLKHFELAVSGLPNVPVHVDLVVELLLVLDYEGFEGSVFVAFQIFEKPLRGSQLLLLVYTLKRVLRASEHDSLVDSRQVVLVEDAVEVGVVAEQTVGPLLKSHRAFHL